MEAGRLSIPRKSGEALMSKPITDIKKYTISREEQIENDFEEVKEAVADHKDSILKGMKLLQALDEGGTLDTAYAFTNAKHEAIKNIVEEISKEQYTPLLENLPEIVFLLGDLDVKGIREMSSRLNHGLEAMENMEPNQKTNFMDLAKALKDPAVNQSITMMLQFLRGMGQSK